jgi:plasmid stability protein
MTTLTIRDLDDALEERLRSRAARSGRSMEEEARQILSDALPLQTATGADLVQRIRARFSAIGYVDLQEAEREPIQDRQYLIDR